MASPRMSCTMVLAIFIFFHCCISFTNAKYPIGVCYGMNGDNLPAPSDVINLFRQYGIERMRLYDPNPDVLQALRGSQILVSLGLRNEDISGLAISQETANSWVATYVSPYTDINFKYISIGNEVIPGEMAQYVAPAIQNMHNAIVEAGHNNIKVSTVVPSNVLGASSPPSVSTFSDDTASVMTSVVSVLASIGSLLLVNVYPYFAYVSDPKDISRDFALFTATSPPVKDGDLVYWSLFDAMVDAFYWALEKGGGADVGLVVAESGWPSAGNGEYTTTTLAQTYNANLMNHVLKTGTPKRPNTLIDTFLFAMFNEDLKQPGAEQNFGLFYPNMQPVYPIFQ